jgi:hypothetical protein
LDGKTEFDKDSAKRFLSQFADNGQASLGHSRSFIDQRVCSKVTNHFIMKFQFSLNPRCESFWVCAGFEDLYQTEDVVTGEIKTNRHYMQKYIGDHRHKLGELAFTMRDELTAQIRLQDPMTVSFKMDSLTYLGF